ncbi:hypothetical protein GW915_02615 [bacterium]|nr:hypothetical protein [bacterium]
MRTILVFAALTLFSQAGFSRGYSIFLNGGMDNVRDGEERKVASFGQVKISTQGRLFRLHSGFTVLSGTEYVEGEAALGLSLYLLTPFVDPKAIVFPFLYGEGTAGIAYYQKAERQDFGYGYGAGVDIKFLKHSGLSFSISQHSATETTIRYTLGFFWISE